MLKQLFQKVINWLTEPTSANSALDRFVSSKNPKNAADVDYWVRIYDQLTTRNWI